MWRISSSLTGSCCYRDQTVLYCKIIRTTVNEIYRNGKKVLSGYIGPNTRIIYRSDSSRLVFFIQMSAEMWHFEEQGHIVFHKMINSFFPEVLRRWRNQDSHHVVTIILFTSVDTSGDNKRLQHGETAKVKNDYFRVVVDQLDITNNWDEIMEKLRYEFTRFDKDVLLQENGKIAGRILPAVKGNILEAINIVTKLVSGKYRDRDLRRTGVQALIVTPGTGIYDVDYDLLYETSNKLTNLEIGIDLVCLGRPPLHVTPLFRFKEKKKGGRLSHCVPSWLDISFWSSNERKGSLWIPRCKIYEIQMMGVMENEVSAIAIDHLPQAHRSKPMAEVMDLYDSKVFGMAEPTSVSQLENDKKNELESAPTIIANTREPVAPQQTDDVRPAVTAAKSTIGIVDISGIDVPIVQPKVSALTSLLSADMAIKRAVSSSSSSLSSPSSSCTPISPSLSAITGSGISSAPISPNLAPTGAPLSATGSLKSAANGGSKGRSFWQKASNLTLRSLYRAGDDQPEDKTVAVRPETAMANLFKPITFDQVQASSTTTQAVPTTLAPLTAFDAPTSDSKHTTVGGPLSNFVVPLTTSFPATAINTVTSAISTATASTIGILKPAEPTNEARRGSILKLPDFTSPPGTPKSTNPASPTIPSPVATTSSTPNSRPATAGNIPSIRPTAATSSNGPDGLENLIFNIQNSLLPTIQEKSSQKPRDSKVSGPFGKLSGAARLNNITSFPHVKAMPIAQARKRPLSAGAAGPLAVNNPLAMDHANMDNYNVSAAAAAGAAAATTATTTTSVSSTVEPLNAPTGVINGITGNGTEGITGPELKLALKELANNKPEKDEEEHSMWMTIANPSNVPQGRSIDISNYGRWQYVYPRKIKRRTVKWRSLISPAALPLLTSNFPSLRQFRKDYSAQNYDAILYTDFAEYRSTSELLTEMVAIRISMGFQIVAKESVAYAENVRFSGNPNSVFEIVQDDATGKRIYMSLGNQIHRISFDTGINVNVQVYTKHDLKMTEPRNNNDKQYYPLVKSRFEGSYTLTTVDIYRGIPMFNWNQIDQILTGYEDYVLDDPRMYRMRLVLIPVDVPTHHLPYESGGIGGAPDKLTAEELRLEGLRRLAVLLHKDRYYTNYDRQSMDNQMKKFDASIPEIHFYTGDLSSFLLNLNNNMNSDLITDQQHASTGANAYRKNTLFIMPSERFTRKSFARISQLAVELQSERGIRFIDRRWHWKTHYHCFVGAEMVHWLLMNFRDVETADQAVEYGNFLMHNGLFHHVEHRHSFLNGHYFYQLSPEYDEQGASSKFWFSRDGGGGSTAIGSTTGGAGNTRKSGDGSGSETASILSKVARQPLSSTSLKDLGATGVHIGHQRSGSVNEQVPASPALLAQPSLSKNSSPGLHGVSSSQDNSSFATTTNFPKHGSSVAPLPKSRVELSRSMRYNADPQGRSSRPEILTVHLDRVHNPENCFQLRLEWLNATPKFIDEKLVTITRLTEKYGLRLVQVPLEEITQLPRSNPFCSLFRVRMAIDPKAIIRQQNQANNMGSGLAKSPTDSLATITGDLSRSVSSVAADPFDDGSGGLSFHAVSRFSTNDNSCASPLLLEQQPGVNVIEEALLEDPLYYHKFVLRRCEYFHDMSPFDDVLTNRFDVTFSWGRQTYNFFQYVHKSGLCIAQVLNDGEFVLVINSLAVNRVEPSRWRQDSNGPANNDNASDNDSNENSTGSSGATKPEELLEQFREVCTDAGRLRALFDEATRLWLTKGRPDSSQQQDVSSVPSSTVSTPQLPSQG